MWFLTVVRFLLGLAIGISIVVAPAYIAESAPVSVRGSMLVTFQIATTSGIALFANFIVGVVFLGALGALGDFRDLPRPGAGLVGLCLRTRPRDQGTTTRGDPHLLVQQRPLARGDPHVSLP